jgi:hypothetical protein
MGAEGRAWLRAAVLSMPAVQHVPIGQWLWRMCQLAAHRPCGDRENLSHSGNLRGKSSQALDSRLERARTEFKLKIVVLESRAGAGPQNAGPPQKAQRR